MRISRPGTLCLLVAGLAISGHSAIVTVAGDQIYGIQTDPFNPGIGTVAGVGSGANNNYFPNGLEVAASAIDNNVGTKYNNAGGTAVNLTAGRFEGLIVTPSMGATVPDSIQFVTANDQPIRDPLTIQIYGTNDLIPSGVAAGSTITATWSLLFSGGSGLSTDPGRSQPGALVPFVPAISGGFTSYQILFTSTRSSADSVQLSEMFLDGIAAAVPEPSLVRLFSIGLAAVISVKASRRWSNERERPAPRR